MTPAGRVMEFLNFSSASFSSKSSFGVVGSWPQRPQTSGLLAVASHQGKGMAAIRGVV